MKNMYDIIIIGAGAAGLSAALEAYDEDLNILIIEREKTFGGILNQCIHNGFGLHVFKQELTGPEYAQKLIDLVLEKNIDYLLDTTVLNISKDEVFKVKATNVELGEVMITSKSVVLTTGCYERARGHVDIPGDRPKGIMTAGSAQRYLNIDGYLVGKKVFILGSGDIGLIMARRMTLEGAKVLGVAELMPFSNGLTRNIVQCLNDFDIPLYLSHTIKQIIGKERVEKVIIQQVDENRNFIEGTEKTFEIDTLLLSIGLIPDIKLFDELNIDIDPLTKSAIVNQKLETSIKGLFACGNALHVHDLVDDVTIESKKAGKHAKAYVLNEDVKEKNQVPVKFDKHIRYVVPQIIDYHQSDEAFDILFRTTQKHNVLKLMIKQGDQCIKRKTLKFVAPAEMQKIRIEPKDLINTLPLEIMMEEELL